MNNSTAAMSRLRFLASAVMMLAAAACAGTSTGTTSPSPGADAAAGTYALKQVTGNALPTLTVPTIAGISCTGFTDSGTLVLKSSPQTYEATMNAHFVCLIPPINNVTTAEQGTWTVNGTAVAFTHTGGVALNMGAGALTGSTMAIALDAPSYTQGLAGVRVLTQWGK